MSSCKSSKTVLIGVDGGTFALLDPLMGDGLMPNLNHLTKRGVRAPLVSTAHPLTPPAWTTLMTGRTPGNHGVYDFIRVDCTTDPPSYTLANASDVKCETLWSMATRQGCKVTCLNFPMMFPAPRLEGANIIPGYVPWSYLARAVYPRDLYARIRERQGFNAKELATDWQQERQAVQGLAEDNLEDWVQFHLVRERRWFEILKFLTEEEPAELTAVLYDGTDRIQHLCYHLIDKQTAGRYGSPASLRARDLALQYYRELDGFIGEMIAAAGPEATIVVASDHGFALAGDRIFYANTWLAENGYLRWRDDAPIDSDSRVALDENTEVGTLFDWSQTKAFAFSSSSNAIHIRKARGPGEPGVTAEEYPEFRDALVRKLLAVRDPETGERMITRVMTRDEVFPGISGEQAPDLTLVLADLGFLSVLRSDASIKPRTMPYATHHPDGIFIAAGPGLRCNSRVEPLSINDITPILLYSLGLPLSPELEGRVPESIYESGHFDAHPVRFAEGEAAGRVDPQGDLETLSPEAEAQIRERLKALGYL